MGSASPWSVPRSTAFEECRKEEVSPQKVSVKPSTRVDKLTNLKEGAMAAPEFRALIKLNGTTGAFFVLEAHFIIVMCHLTL